MITMTPSTPETYALAAAEFAGADPDKARKYLEDSIRFLANGESHTRSRGVKHPHMIALHLNDDSIHMLDKFTDFLKSTGQLNLYAKRQDFIRMAMAEAIMRQINSQVAQA